MGKGKRSRLHHDDIVKILARRLHDIGTLDTVLTHEFYDTGKYRGEVDVLAHSKDRWRFYEVKTTDNERAYNHALDQYWRYCRAHPDRDVAGIYVTTTCVQRMPRYRPNGRKEQSSQTTQSAQIFVGNKAV